MATNAIAAPQDRRTLTSLFVWSAPSLADIFFLTILLIFLGAASSILTADGDAARHIAVGTYMLDQHAVPTVDVFSHTMGGRDFVPYEWLAEIAYALAYRLLGLAGPVLLAGGVTALTFSLLFRFMLERGTNVLVSVGLTCMAASAAATHWLARPHIFTLLFAMLWYRALDRHHRGHRTHIFLLPIMMVVWANMHGGLLIGFVLLGIYGIAEVIAWRSGVASVHSVGAQLWSSTNKPGTASGGGSVGSKDTDATPATFHPGRITPVLSPVASVSLDPTGLGTWRSFLHHAILSKTMFAPGEEGRVLGGDGTVRQGRVLRADGGAGRNELRPYGMDDLADRLSDDSARRSAEAGRRLRTLVVVGVLSLAATLVNPASYNLIPHLLGYFRQSYAVNHTQEYLSPNFHNASLLPFILLLLGSLAMFALSRSRAGFLPLALVSVFTYFALYSTRNLPLFAIVVTPIIAQNASGLLREWRAERHSDLLDRLARRLRRTSSNILEIERQRRGHLVPVLVLVALGLAFLPAHPSTLGLSQPEFRADRFPVAAARFVEEQQIPGKMFNDLIWGGYLIYRLYPDYPVFIDGQTDFYGDRLVREYTQVVDVQPGWETVLDKHDVGWIIQPSGSALAILLGETDRWRLIYRDGTAEIFVRNAPSYQELIDRYGRVEPVRVRRATAVNGFPYGNP